MIKNLIKKTVPVHVLESVKRNLFYGFSDLMDTLAGRREDMVPPKRMIFIGGMDFKKVGDEFLGHFRDLAGLSPDASVLDVGSGIGRMARPLTGYLSKAGRYEGIDIDSTGVAWCRKHISSRFPNFNFQRADIYNKYYNPKGRHKSSEYRFPYRDAQFDFAYLTSVFTHMFPADVDNYLKEIARTLKPGGKSLITWFLANPESRKLIAAGRSALDFRHEMDGYLTVDTDVPENAIGFEEEYVRGLYRKHGLEVDAIRYGSWCGRGEFLSFQDIVLARKPA